MSDKSDCSLTRIVGQDQDNEKCEINSAEELIRLQCTYYRNANALLTLETAERLGSRLANLAQGSFLPSGGFADVATLAGLLNLDQRSVFDQMAKANHEGLGFGRTVFYSVATWFFAPRKKDMAEKPAKRCTGSAPKK